MSVIQIQFRRDTAANWTSANPVLAQGELGLDLTNLRVKLGDGSTAWNTLAYQMNTLFHGAGAPAGGLGVNGDIYFDDTNKGYYAKAAGSWGSIISLQGATGTTGATGPGVPIGGTTNQVLKKNSGTDFDTSWAVVPNDGTTLETAGGALRIKDAGVTNGKLANMASATIKGQTAGGSGAPVDLTAAQAKTALAIANTDISGLGTLSTQSGTFSGTHSGSSSGTNTGDQTLGSLGAVPTSRLINTTAPLAGGGSLAADLTLSMTAATALAAGSMSAANFIKTRTTGLYYDIVADGGAVFDGVTDCRAIIENAHTMLAAFGGGVVYYPPVGDVTAGKGYAVNSTITLTGNFVTHRGANSVVSLVKRTFAGGNTYTVNGANCQFEDLRIIGATSTLATSGYAIEVTSTATNVTVVDCDIIYHWSGIRATGQLCRMRQLNIREMGANAANGQGILVDAFTDQFIDGIVMDNPTNPTGFAGIRITNLSSLQLMNSQVIHCTNALDVVPTGTNTIPSIHAFNTFFDNSVIGCNLGGAVGSTIVRSIFLQCWFSSCSTAGVRINNANVKGVDFVACEAYGNPLGFDVLDATEWSISGKSRISGNSGTGIRVALGTVPHAFSIIDNFIGNGSNFGANGLGISVAAGTYSRYEIRGNRGLDTNTTPGITDAGTTVYPSQKLVADNMGAGQLSGVAVRLLPPVTIPSLLTTEQVAITLPIAANAVSAGTTFRIRLRGQAGAATVITARLKVGTAAGIGTGVVSTLVSTAQALSAWFTVDFDCTVGTPGAAAPVSGGGNGTFQGASVSPATAVYTAPTINTTAPWWLTVTLAQGTAAGAIPLRHGTIIVDSVN